MAKRITEQQPTTGLADSDVLATAKSAEDYKATLQQMFDYMFNKLEAQDIMDLVKQVDTNSSGLNANFLQGNDTSFFRNASNLNAGTVAASLLPVANIFGDLQTYTSADPAVPGSVRVRHVLKLPPAMFGGEQVMVQFGDTNFILEGQYTVTSFPQSFNGGLGGQLPWISVSPETVGDAGGDPRDQVELDIRLQYNTITNSKFHAIALRTRGSGPDRVRGKYIAIGRY